MSHCCKFTERPITRRQMLLRGAQGFGAIALSALMADRAWSGLPASGLSAHELPAGAALRGLHHAPRAKNVIFLYMDGGVSHVDSFDPKPLLTAEDGQPFKPKMEPTQFNNNGSTFGSPWEFTPRGSCGTPVSSLFPMSGDCADEFAVIRSMVSNFSEHNAANYFLHSGLGQAGRPSIGAWMNYGLGSENQNLPGFVVLNGGLIPSGGMDNFAAGFLPASNQGSILRVDSPVLSNISPLEPAQQLQRNKLDLMRRMDERSMAATQGDDAIESAIRNYELAFAMQSAIPELTDLSSESEVVRKMYGLDAEFEQTRIYAAQCLLARRLVERGVRFIELTCPKTAYDRWDAHSNLRKNHGDNALAVDQPIAALLKDLKALGMLEETLVVFAGEFGRTPFAQGRDGRDHNPFAFSIWMAGGGVKGGLIYGATDEYGYKVVENKVEIHDLHATMLHLLGVDHKQLTYRYGGRDMRLTDVHGEIIHPILA